MNLAMIDEELMHVSLIVFSFIVTTTDGVKKMFVLFPNRRGHL